MEDNGNNNEEMFTTVFGARIDKSVRGTINDIKKLMSNVDDSKNIRFTSDAKFNKQFTDSIKTWDKISKKYAKTSLLSKFFGDRKAYADANRMFNKLKGKAGKIQTTYNERLNKLLGNNVEDNFGGSFGDTLKGIGDNEQKLKDLTKELEDLTNKRDVLLNSKQNFELFPDEQKIIAEQETLRTNLQQLQTLRDQIAQQEFKPLGATTDFTDARNQVMDYNKELSKLAITQFNRTGKDTLFKELKTDIQNTINEHKQNLTDISNTLNNLREQQTSMTKEYNKQLKAFSNNPDNVNQDTLNDTENKLEDIKKQIQSLIDQRYRIAIQLELDKKRMNQYTQYYKKRGDVNVGFAQNKRHTTEELQPKFDAAMRKLHTRDSDFTAETNNLTFLEDLKNLDVQIDNTKSKISALDKGLHNLGQVQGNKQNILNELEDTEQKIKDNERAQKEVKIQTDKLWVVYNNILNEVIKIRDEWEKLQNDLGSDPMHANLTNEQLQTMNDEIDQNNLATGRFAKSWQKIHNWVKKSNVITRVGRRILINIRSQVASLLNPLNLWRKGWNDWLDRFENKQLKNTFEMIKYNLVSAFEPLFKISAQVLLKLAQIANIFTKKLAGVDLFDGTDWKKNKQELDNITSGLDELHDVGKTDDTIFDSGDFKMEPLGEGTEQFFSGIADGLKGAWDWASNFIKEHPLLSAGLGLLLGTKFGRSLLWGAVKLVGKGIKSLFTGGAAKQGAEAGGTLLGGLFGKTLYTGMAGKAVTVGKFLGGLGLTVGGTALAFNQAIDAGKHWQDLTPGMKAVKVGAVGLGAAAAGLGAVMLGASGPIGWAVAGTVALGAFTVGMFQTQNGIGSLKEETKEWEDAQERMNEALANAEQANADYNNALINLKELEESTGESGKALADAVNNGRLSVDQMTSSQLKVYQAYLNTQKVLDVLIAKNKEATEAIRAEAKEHTEVLLVNAKESGSYDELAEHINTCWQNGTMTTEQARDTISRCMADMSESARQEMLEKLAPALQQGLDVEKYESGWSHFGQFWEEMWTNAVGVHDASIADMQATEQSLLETTESLKQAQEDLTEAQNNLSQAEQNAGMTIEELTAKIDSGEIAIYEMTDAQKALYQANIDLQNASAETDKAMAKNEKQLVGLAKQSYKTSGDWKAFIDKLVKANKDGQISVETMSKEIGIAMGEADNDTEQFMREYVKGLGIMTNDVETACKDQKGFFSSLFDSARNTWQSICNWFGGKGYKTNAQIEIDAINNSNLPEEEKRKRISALANVKAYAVGTNYVPNDQLAFVHQGEAIIPAKYNKPYTPTNNSQLTDTINAMNNEIGQLRQLINAGIPVKGEFRQRGNDLVAVVEKGRNKNGNSPLNNPAYAR